MLKYNYRALNSLLILFIITRNDAEADAKQPDRSFERNKTINASSVTSTTPTQTYSSVEKTVILQLNKSVA